MKSIDWKLIDDNEFVHLCMEVLTCLGFIDLQRQGDGPDGGLDLFATEPLSFAVAGVRPHRWGVQCKFSTEGQRRSVADREIRDVEGIMRSDRYALQGARGYMLVTNRRVSQNVVERLTGIDRQSSFRACFLDGVRLEKLLLDYPRLVDRYFRSATAIAALDLGTPIIEVDGGPTAGPGLFPDIEVELERRRDSAVIGPPGDPTKTAGSAPPARSARKATVRAIIDTGARVSCMPSSVLADIGARDYTIQRVTWGSGGVTDVLKYCVDLHLIDRTLRDVWVLGIDRKYGLIGADVLKQFTILFNGPAGSLKMWG